MAIRILDVGQCGFDGPRMKEIFESRLDAAVDGADDLAEARERIAAETYDLILVNRVLAGSGGSGLEVVKALTGRGHPPVILVSDREEAQAAAVAEGALRGFGKAELEAPETLDLILAASLAKGSATNRD